MGIDRVKGNSFEFNRVTFKTVGPVLTNRSMIRLKNMAVITRAFPLAAFELVGFTGNTGSAAGNMTLSQKRANAVVAVLKKPGASPKSFTGAKGYGAERPIESNTTPEGRAQNQRISALVKAK